VSVLATTDGVALALEIVTANGGALILLATPFAITSEVVCAAVLLFHVIRQGCPDSNFVVD
jgi:hypothetical protein